MREALLDVNRPTAPTRSCSAAPTCRMVRLADEAERWLGKPVIAINAATWWMALRDNGINDKL